MAGSSGFYKGEKKKQKKDKEAKSLSSDAPAFVLPKIISKKKESK